MEQETQTPHKRRVRYKGKYPKKFEEKYKELPAGEISGYDRACDPEGKYAGGNAYLDYGKRNSGLFAD